jgi:hypothetical protein
MSLPASGIQPEQEIVMIKLHAGYARKVPGQEQYSSDSASASVEIELPEGTNIPAKLAELWDITRSAVENQLGQRQPVNRVAQHMPDNNGGQRAPAAHQVQPARASEPPAPQRKREWQRPQQSGREREAAEVHQEPDR